MSLLSFRRPPVYAKAGWKPESFVTPLASTCRTGKPASTLFVSGYFESHGNSPKDQPRLERHARLGDHKQSAIREADAAASVCHFGSRTDDAAKGGDIDLLVLSKKITFMAKLRILAQLHQKLGERKIDIAASTIRASGIRSRKV